MIIVLKPKEFTLCTDHGAKIHEQISHIYNPSSYTSFNMEIGPTFKGTTV